MENNRNTAGQNLANFLKEFRTEINEKLDIIDNKLSNQKRDINLNVNRNNTQVNNGNSGSNIRKELDNWYGLRVPSYIPDITGKQIYKLNKMGWSIQQICAISGYSQEEAKKKYDTYVRNNV
jgi:hypothetical protein